MSWLKGRFTYAADVFKRALGVPILPDARKAEICSFRARVFRQLAESKKTPRNAEVEEDHSDGEDTKENGHLHGLAAEWAIEEADEALRLDPSCYLAAWEGAIAAKHIG